MMFIGMFIDMLHHRGLILFMTRALGFLSRLSAKYIYYTSTLSAFAVFGEAHFFLNYCFNVKGR